MIWEITAYNGTKKLFHCNLDMAINMFYKETGLCQMDIKSIINLH